MNRSTFAWTCFLWFAFLWWQGGFMFYSAIVVHIANSIVDPFEQGRITARVMYWLNGFGILTISLLFLDIRMRAFRPRAFLWVWFALLASQLALLILHDDMMYYLDYDSSMHKGKQRFRSQHEWYMRLTTAQWVCSLAWMGWMIRRSQFRESLTSVLNQSKSEDK